MAVVYKVPTTTHWCTTVVSCAVYPFLSLYTVVTHPIKTWLFHARDSNALRATIVQLEEANQKLQAELVKYHATEMYAQQTHELRVFAQRYESRGVVAQVLHIVATEHEQTMLVNAGSWHWRCKNYGLRCYRILSRRQSCCSVSVVSQVRLITDKRCKVGAVCATTGAVGIYHGCNDQSHAVIEHVSHLDTVQEGDYIISTGKGLVFPQGFALGVVTSATVNALNHDIMVKPALSFDSLSYCLLIAKESCEKH